MPMQGWIQSKANNFNVPNSFLNEKRGLWVASGWSGCGSSATDCAALLSALWPSWASVFALGGRGFPVPLLCEPLPLRFCNRILRVSAYASPMNPSRSKKHLKAYFSLSTSLLVARMRCCCFAMSHKALSSCV